ncbi:hypothetical protein MBANPS3_010269 [Mucor bainieri]
MMQQRKEVMLFFSKPAIKIHHSNTNLFSNTQLYEMPLQYFETTSPNNWELKDIFEAIQKEYPDKERAYHGLSMKKELEQLKTHSKQSFRERAQSLLQQFKLPSIDPKRSPPIQHESSSSIQFAKSVINNAHTINQAAQQTIYQKGSRSVIPTKRPYSEDNNVSSDDNEDDDLEDLFPSTTGRTGGSLNDPFTNEDDSTPSHSLPIPPERLNPNLSAQVLSRLSCTGDYRLNGIDYAAMFTKLKVQAYHHLSNASVIYLEPQFTRLIALEHTLFLKPGSYTEDMISTFGVERLNDLHRKLLRDHFQSDVSVVNTLVSELYTVFDEFTEIASMKQQLKDLKRKHKSTEALRVISCLKELLKFLPTNKEKDAVINETDMKIRYIQPIMKYFGNDLDSEEFMMRYPERNPVERKLYKHDVQRPDAIVSKLSQGEHTENIGYMEVKSSYYANRKRALMMDMYRLVYFARNSIDVSSLNGPLLMQVVGFKVNVYQEVLISKGFYVVYFVFGFDLPACKDDINLLLPNLKKLLMMYNVFKNCNVSNCRVDEQWCCPVENTPPYERRVVNTVYKGDYNTIVLN